MAFVIRFIKGVRNHWKKSTFAALAIVYGANYTKEHFQTQELMRAYCNQALIYGNQPISVAGSPRNITVILNPNANKRKATKLFDSYCAPILHLAGICVDVIQTKSEGHARTLVEELKQTDAIIIAGGDGTVSDVVTGLMRRSNSTLSACPVGILPLGRTNSIANVLFPGGDTLETVTSLAEASLAIVEENKKRIDVMKIEVQQEEANTNKPVYAVGSLEWGAYRDALAKTETYWYFGPLRKYATYIFNGYKQNLNWECAADVAFSAPCDGCQNCYVKPEVVPETKSRWFSSFATPAKPVALVKDYSRIVNDNCVQINKREILTPDVSLTTSLLENNSDASYLSLNLGPSTVSYVDFVNQGWQFVNGQPRDVLEKIQLKQIEILPKHLEKELWFSIDKENYELKPVKITLLPKVLYVYCKKETTK